MGDDGGIAEGISIPVDGIVRAAYAVSHLEKLIRVAELAEQIHHSLPKRVRKACELDTVDAFDEDAVSMLAFGLARVNPKMLADLHRTLCEIRQYVGVWVDEDDDEHEGPTLYGCLDESEIQVVEQMLVFVQRLGSCSIRHLLNFLEAGNAGDRAYLIIQTKGRESEIRNVFHLSDEAKRDFDLK